MIHTLLEGRPTVLASSSPRRKQIFDMIGVKMLILPADIDETIVQEPPRKLVCRHAEGKARAVAEKFDSDTLVIGADTIVYHRGEILGKPRDAQQAAEYLARLSGDTHAVYTGVSLIRGTRVQTDVARSSVRFSRLTPREIDEYVAAGEPLDKAGAYGIQGLGCQFIEKINGCYFNVMGFPVSLFYELLLKITR
jgi:septum formation protein